MGCWFVSRIKIVPWDEKNYQTRHHLDVFVLQASKSGKSKQIPLKFNMEPENQPLEKEIPFWKPSFSGSMLVFGSVSLLYVLFVFGEFLKLLI